MKKNKICRVSIQGAPIIDYAWIEEYEKDTYSLQSAHIVLIGLDLHTRHCEVAGEGWTGKHPSICFEATEATIKLSGKDSIKKGKNLNALTEVVFTAFGKGWDIKTASISKYTCFVCLTKEREGK